MKRQALFFGTVTAMILAFPAFAGDGAAGMLDVRWGKNVFNFEGMPSGPQPLRNLSRLPNGKANNGRLVGDWHNPILTPEAAAIVKAKGELAIAGKGFPDFGSADFATILTSSGKRVRVEAGSTAQADLRLAVQ